MACEDRRNPAGKVLKWRSGDWSEPGIGGRVTPIFPAAIDWHRTNADALWGPSVHWNTYLGCWVMLLNRAKDKNWTQKGIYVSYRRDIANPTRWSAPVKLMSAPSQPGWYPQVLGMEKGETDKIAGRAPRPFIHGVSRWQIEFRRSNEG